MKRYFLALAFTLWPLPVIAQVSSSATSNQGQASSSAGALLPGHILNTSETQNQSTVGGTVNNVGVNSSGGQSLPSFTGIRDLRCEQPTLEVGAFLNQSFVTTGGLVGSIRIPLGNQAHSNCLRLSETYASQAEYDTWINTAKFCLENPEISLESAPLFIQEVCNSL